MPKGSYAVKHRPAHGVLQHSGVKKQVRLDKLPDWHGWRYRSEAARIRRWVESTVRLPVGLGAGNQMRLAPFQIQLLKTICDSLATFVSIPAANGKTTLMAAVALERVCRGDDYVEVDVLATNEEQAERLVTSCLHMVESSPGLPELFAYYAHDAILEYRPTGSRIKPHPAKLTAIQGLNFSLCLVDEIGDVYPEIASSMLARLGKRDDSRVIAFGTPGTSMRDNLLDEIRKQAHDDALPAGVRYVEYAAEPGCAIDDRKQWKRANPASEAGFLRADEVLPLQMATLPEHQFRAWHLGQPVESSGPWLPSGAWDDCQHAEPPAAGVPVVLALEGSYRRQAALVGSTLDGSLFFGWQASAPSDEEVAAQIRKAGDKWQLVEVCHNPNIRMRMTQKLADEGFPMEPWPLDVATDADSTAGFYEAITEGTLAHDHHTVLTEQVARLSAKVDRQGRPRLMRSAEMDVSAALAARVAWWRARALADAGPTEELVIY